MYLYKRCLLLLLSLLTFIDVFSVKRLSLLSKSGCGTRLKYLLSVTISHYQELFGKLVPQALLALQPTGNLTKEELKALPDTLQLRLVRYRIQIPGCRCQEVILVTTLLDVQLFSAAQLAQLYFRRWSVELHFHQIKILLGMDVLRCLSPAMVRKELLMHLVAYNLIRALM